MQRQSCLLTDQTDIDIGDVPEMPKLGISRD